MKVTKHGSRSNGDYVLEFESKAERFCYQLHLEYLKLEGCPVPRFYLPVRRIHDVNCMECWVFPLAPFVALWHLFAGVFRSLWKDFISLVNDMILYSKR